MAYEKLARLIGRIEGAPIEVPDAYLFKFGALLVADSTIPETEANKYSAAKTLRDSSQGFPKDIKDISEAIRAGGPFKPGFYGLEWGGKYPIKSMQSIER